MKKYVAYYRVSTKEQGNSGFGLDSQKQIVKDFCKDGELIKGFKDVESGKNNNRVGLKLAIKECITNDAILVIAKLDRLSRNLTFISNLMDSKVKFICCDMPDANEFTIGIFAVLAQQERKMISERTKAGLKAKVEKERILNPEFKLGKPENFSNESREKGRDRVSEIFKEKNKIAISIAWQDKKSGKKLKEISDRLNELGLKTSNGCEFSITHIRRLLERSRPKITEVF